MQNMPIAIFRGDDTDALGYQTIVGTIKTDLDLTGCKAVFRYLGFSVEFDPIPADKKLTVIIPASETAKFPPGLGYASLRVFDSEGKLCTFSNRIMVFVATKTPMFGNAEFEVDFNVRPALEPLKIFVGPNPDDFDEYRGFLERVIDRASAAKYGLAMLLDAIDSDLGADDGVAATPAAVKAAYAAVIGKLTDEYYTKEETDEAIDRVAAYYITYDAVGHAFPTHADLVNAQTYYSGGKARTPTCNDYAIVLADETHEGSEYRYIYAVAEGQTVGQWEPQYPVEGVMTVDQTVTRNSPNPVSGGGVWSAIWGALVALPTGFASLYDWCVSQLADKLDKSGGTVNGALIIDGDLTIIGNFADRPVRKLKFSNGSVPAEFNGYTFKGHFGGSSFATIRLPWHQDANNPATLVLDKELAPAWESGTAYTANKLCSYNGVVYQNTSGATIQSATTPDTSGSGWTAKPVSDLFLPLTGGTMTGSLTAQNISATSDVTAPDVYTSRTTASDALVLSIDATDTQAIGIFKENGNLTIARRDGKSATIVFSQNSATLALSAGPNHAGNLAALDASGNPTDSGVKASDKLDSTSAAPAFSNDSSVSYPVGSHCTHQGKLYKCTTATTGGTWVAGSWTADAASNYFQYALTTPTQHTGSYGISVTLSDRAINEVSISTIPPHIVLAFPTLESGKARDFALRLELATSTAAAPELEFPQGVTLENEDGEVPEIAVGTTTILYFSETATNKFLVKGETLTAITQA